MLVRCSCVERQSTPLITACAEKGDGWATPFAGASCQETNRRQAPGLTPNQQICRLHLRSIFSEVYGVYWGERGVGSRVRTAELMPLLVRGWQCRGRGLGIWFSTEQRSLR